MDIKTAFVLTLLAGLSTSIGGAAALCVRKPSKAFMSVCLGLSGGVMLCVSLVELVPSADEVLSAAYGKAGRLLGALSFTVGMLVTGAIDKLFPETAKTEDRAPSLRTGLITAAAMLLHNFPEGLATFVGSVGLGDAAPAAVAAIALHNIPEGVAVAAPVYSATGSRIKAFLLSVAAGLAEPLGALAAITLVGSSLTPTLCAVMFAATAGIMTHISLFTLMPAADSDRAVFIGGAVMYGVLTVV